MPSAFAHDPFFRFLQAVDGAFVPPTGTATPPASGPRVHAAESDDAITLIVDLPEVEDEGLTLDVTEESISIVVEAPAPRETGDEFEFRRRERRAVALSRTFQIGHRVDVNGVSASLTNGVLTIVAPKARPARRSIALTTKD